MTPARPTRVFIADDSAMLQAALLEALTAIDGLEVVGQAMTGAETIRGVQTTQPDLVLLDISMPDGDGFSVLEALRPADRRPFFIVVTLYAQPEFHRRCRELGAHVFADKARDIQQVFDALETLAARDFDLRDLQAAFSPHTKPQPVTA